MRGSHLSAVVAVAASLLLTLISHAVEFTIGLGTALSDVPMKRQASSFGWDLSSIWTICEGRGYPRLRWAGAACAP